MQSAGLGLAAYRAAPDKTLAFETLAALLNQPDKAMDLEALLEEHRRRPGATKGPEAEALVTYYRGQLHLLRGEPNRALEQFTAALAKGSTNRQWLFRQGLLQAKVKSGRAASAYHEYGADTATFESLASLCIQNKDARQFQALLTAYRKSQPEDSNVPAWDLELLWLNQDYDGALKLLDAHRAELFDLPRHAWKAADYRVRALVKLKRTMEAIQAAEAAVKDKNGNQVLLVLAHAAHGDVKQALAAVEKFPPRSYWLRSCYQDTDLGPLLRNERFKEFRDRFPEPKKMAEEGPD
jgi:hypothetical protein